MKRYFVALIRMMLWYEAQFWSDRIAFAGGVLAGTLIPLAVGMIGVGYGFNQSLVSVIFASIVFVVILVFASAVFYIGKKYGDREPMEKILQELDERG
jgi:membrane protein DedA with SNARE-associated domain